MADRSSFVGARLRVTSNEGDFEGTVHSIDTVNRKLTLTKGEQFDSFWWILIAVFRFPGSAHGTRDGDEVSGPVSP